MKCLKVVNNRIVFATFQTMYTCNPKYIAQYMIDNNYNYDIYWVVLPNNYELDYSNIPFNIKLVEHGSREYYKVLATSKIWIENAGVFSCNNVLKKKNQIYINTWHGSLGIKKINIENIADIDSRKRYYKMSKNVDYVISNSSFENYVYSSTYFRKSNILKLGHARNDILFNLNNFIKYKSILIDFYKDQIIKLLGENFDKTEIKFCIFAPTFRDNIEGNDFCIDYSLLCNTLKSKFGGKWFVIVRLHDKLKNIKIKNYCNDNIIDATNYPDIQELLCASDFAITDYSSWIFDYILTKKPSLLFAPDINEYKSSRGLYYPLEDTPFLISKNMNELIDNINNFSIAKYLEKVNSFINRLGCIDDGDSTQRIVNKVMEISSCI